MSIFFSHAIGRFPRGRETAATYGHGEAPDLAAARGSSEKRPALAQNGLEHQSIA